MLAEESLDAIELPDFLIQSAEDALDVFDFHTVAKHKLPPAHYGYLATGTDGINDLHEADTVLDQTSGHDALGGVRGAIARLRAIHRECRFGFA